MCLSMTDLPDPEGPSSTVVLAVGRSRLNWSRTTWVPNALRRFTSRMIGSASAGGRSATAGSAAGTVLVTVLDIGTSMGRSTIGLQMDTNFTQRLSRTVLHHGAKFDFEQ